MNRIGTVIVLIVAVSASRAPTHGFGGSDNAISSDIAVLAKQGRGSTAGRAAWDRLSQAGPEALVPLLNAMSTSDTVVANWMRTAFDPIVERALKMDGKRIDADALLGFVRDARRQGRTRRLALEVVEKLRPGTSEKLYPGWLDDPEFRYEAVERVLAAAGGALKKKLAKDAEQ